MNRETEVLDFIDTIPHRAVLYDLGACEGRFAIYAALRGIRTYAFEPEELNFAALEENLRLNGLHTLPLVPFRCAVGRQTETAKLKIGQPWAGGHQRVLLNGAGRADLRFGEVLTQTVDVVSLDDMIDDENLPIPNFLKVDVDGSELAFLEGARRTLRRPELQGIIFELCRTDAGYLQVLRLLDAAGFVRTDEHEVEPELFNIVFRREARSRSAEASWDGLA
jgi:FkbM family methyltransferase